MPRHHPPLPHPLCLCTCIHQISHHTHLLRRGGAACPQDIGWRLSGQKGSLAEGVVAARHFNEVQISGDLVIKTAATSVLRGEMFFYSRMPARAASVPPDRGGSLAWGSLA